LRDDFEETLEAVEDGRDVTLANDPRAVYWRAIAAAANDLPRNYRRRAFILDAATTGNVVAASRDHHLKPDQGDRIWWAFLAKSKLPKQSSKAHSAEEDPAPLPSPARSLSPKERLQLQAQRQPPPGPRRVYSAPDVKRAREREARENLALKNDGCNGS
jgi:hypothetical protein